MRIFYTWVKTQPPTIGCQNLKLGTIYIINIIKCHQKNTVRPNVSPDPLSPLSHDVAGSSTSLQADQYINSKFQIGSLSSIQPCDELSSLVIFSKLGWFSGSTISTLLHDKINPKDRQVLSLGDSGFLQFFRVVSSDYGKPRFLPVTQKKHSSQVLEK